jgi:hypothetical protein
MSEPLLEAAHNLGRLSIQIANGGRPTEIEQWDRLVIVMREAEKALIEANQELRVMKMELGKYRPCRTCGGSGMVLYYPGPNQFGEGCPDC